MGGRGWVVVVQPISRLPATIQGAGGWAHFVDQRRERIRPIRWVGAVLPQSRDEGIRHDQNEALIRRVKSGRFCDIMINPHRSVIWQTDQQVLPKTKIYCLVNLDIHFFLFDFRACVRRSDNRLQSLEHQLDHRDQHHRLAAVGQLLVVLAQPPIPPEPAKCPFNDPSSRLYHKPLRTFCTLHNLHLPAPRLFHQCGQLPAVSPVRSQVP